MCIRDSFNTAMVGYPEALTDPSYRGQLLVLTFPLIGNYGVPSDQKDDLGLSLYFESANIHISALIVSEYSSDSAHWNLDQSLGAWLKKAGVPAIYGVDTRALTKHIRERGAMLGKIIFEGTPVGGAAGGRGCRARRRRRRARRARGAAGKPVDGVAAGSTCLWPMACGRRAAGGPDWVGPDSA